MLYRLGYGKRGFAQNDQGDPIENFLDTNTVSYAVFENLAEDGALIDSVAAAQGLNWIKQSDGERPVYDSSLFNGRGGIKSANSSAALKYDGTFGAGAAHTIYAAVYLPQNPLSGSEAQLVAFGTDNDARLTAGNNSGNSYDILYGRNQSGGYPRFVDDATNFGVHVFALRIKDLNTMELFWDSTSVTGTIDPRDDYSTIAYLRLFSRSSGGSFEGLGYGRFLHQKTADNDASLAAKMNALAGIYGVSLS